MATLLFLKYFNFLNKKWNGRQIFHVLGFPNTQNGHISTKICTKICIIDILLIYVVNVLKKFLNAHTD